ncbi:hypothetical protein [Streptomyces sp. V4I2]|uniref:hypothetical protein n=1 Tax=Streptomyces sp. V4I2 TaxID=3042280 RepID=UPI00278A6636|nr:hypothetical protein [Streptomyces sp. V4I2]MDQ1045012.1 hypothetical protein [Streptomyces sp. V4I2]
MPGPAVDFSRSRGRQPELLAYWVGGAQRLGLSDEIIADPTPGPWTGHKLLPHLIQGLVPHHGYVDLNIHSLWSLLQIRTKC